MHGFQPWYFNKQASGGPPCVTLTWKSIMPSYSAMQGFPFSASLTDLLQTGVADSWSVGGLPTGITYNSSTGAMSGTTNDPPGGYMVFVDATNSCTGTISTTILFNVV